MLHVKKKEFKAFLRTFFQGFFFQFAIKNFLTKNIPNPTKEAYVNFQCDHIYKNLRFFRKSTYFCMEGDRVLEIT